MKKINLKLDGMECAVNAAAEALSVPGAVLLIPTETVYGLVCRASDNAAVDRIYELKDRDRSKKLALFTGDWRRLSAMGVKLGGLPGELAEKYCPGAITIIAPGENNETVGFRVPDHPFVLALLKKTDYILASTSANLSGRPNVLSVDQALAELNGEPDLAVDGGSISPDSLASTVVDATGPEIKILRQGSLFIG